MEMADTSLDKVLYDPAKYDKLTDYDKVSLSASISAGMQHLAREKIAHRDLAARNILLVQGSPHFFSDFTLLCI